MLRQEPSGGSSLASAVEGPKLELQFVFFFPFSFSWPRQPLLMLIGFIINHFCDCNGLGFDNITQSFIEYFKPMGTPETLM